MCTSVESWLDNLRQDKLWIRNRISSKRFWTYLRTLEVRMWQCQNQRHIFKWWRERKWSEGKWQKCHHPVFPSSPKTDRQDTSVDLKCQSQFSTLPFSWQWIDWLDLLANECQQPFILEEKSWAKLTKCSWMALLNSNGFFSRNRTPF